jgi:uncharacterized RDD family membrane protein YckC
MPHLLTAGFAPPWKRLLAALVDGILWTLANVVLGVFVLALAVFTGGWPYSAATPYASALLVGWLYHALTESAPWQATPGKWLVDVRVCGTDGARLTFRRSSVRYFSKLLAAAPLGLGFLPALFRQDRRALHDLVAGTLVVNRPAGETARANSF